MSQRGLFYGWVVLGSAAVIVFLLSTLGMGLGSFAGGWFYDHLGSYAGLFLGSFGIGIAAVLIALTFRPPRTLGARLEVAPSAR